MLLDVLLLNSSLMQTEGVTYSGVTATFKSSGCKVVLSSNLASRDVEWIFKSDYSFWMRIEEAPPPPLQIPARPYCPGCRWCTMCPTILVPDILGGITETKVKTMNQQIHELYLCEQCPLSMSTYTRIQELFHNNSYPIGWPRDTAPPLMFTLLGSMSSILMLARTTTLKASFISHMATSSFFTPAALSTYNIKLLSKQLTNTPSSLPASKKKTAAHLGYSESWSDWEVYRSHGGISKC